MVFPRWFLLFMGTVTILVFMFGYLTVGHSVDPFHILHLCYWVLYFLVSMSVMIWADLSFQHATAEWWSSPSRAERYSKEIGSLATKALVLWLAFWHEHVFVWIVFALALTVLIRIGFRKNPLLY